VPGEVVKPLLTRILVYSALAGLVLSLAELDGYRRGEKKLYEYQAKQATAAVAIVVKRGAVTERVVTGTSRSARSGRPLRTKSNTRYRPMRILALALTMIGAGCTTPQPSAPFPEPPPLLMTPARGRSRCRT
jgi:hypothetical protein